MNAQHRMTLLAATLAGMALFGAGCGNNTTPADRNAANPMTPPATSSMATPDRTATPKATPSDAAITGKVKAAVMAEPGIRSLKIDVDTKDGVVTLNGKIDSQQHKDRAMQIAQNVDGVKSVVNNLTVEASG
jgi:hypothetical protein